ncbi:MULTISPECIES: efflux RND transporter periplasmic adaptor subunit [Cohnella]|uniref:efflux RND transporter periplasmic adaptor subunit n=1 Tax=Cohnella TaxID=329857 RepID=UPI0009BA6CCA|nr:MULTISPECIES: efflux RND transporter periplasmic adaptor subunit [Cohnella]MBN2983821.1 efflux RND transporter periplasmic adaptor subunit [Cohnella algarum]
MQTERRKKTLRLTIGLFFAALLALTFLSNTIQGLSLPKVSVEKPATGGLDLIVTGDGFLEPAHVAQLFASGDWTVENIRVEKNDRVRKGDPLVEFDTASTERTLEDQQTRYKQKQLQLSKMTDQLKTMLRSGDEAGVENLKRDIEIHRLDMQVLEREIDDLKKLIDEGRTLKSPVDGIVTEINVSEGVAANRGQPAVSVADDVSGYTFSITADSDEASMLRIGDSVSVQLDETPPRNVDGIISNIEDAAADADGNANKRITFGLKDADLSPGLKAAVEIRNQSPSFGLQIPKSALHSDTNGYYVFTLTEKDGPLGAAHYVSKTYVTVKDENGDTVVADGLMPDERFVTDASEPISDGDRVRYSS